jgi:mono/diheme cytochrome c family protein
VKRFVIPTGTKRRGGTCLIAVAVAFMLTGCKVIPPPKPLNQLTQQEVAGYNDFQQNCARCHDDREGAARQGPTLLSVYKNQYLPSGAPANDDRIRNVILHGRGMMPGLGNTMSDSQIDDLLAYLKTL